MNVEAESVDRSSDTDAALSAPIVELRRTGDGVRLAKTLVRVLVRRFLLQEGIVGTANDCAELENAR